MPESITQIDFPFHHGRKVRAVFDTGHVSSDGGALLLSRVDRALGFIDSLATSLPDRRDQRYVAHPLEDLLRQRIFQIALGYEDCNDANQLRCDPALKTCCGRDPVQDPDLGSQPTLSRLEEAAGAKTCYLFARQLLESYFERHRERPWFIIIDVDTSADPTHGQQELSFFNAYYDSHVYLPLLIFDQDGDLLTAVLQPGKPQKARGLVPVLKRMVERIRQQWPGICIMLRGDAEFACPEVYRLAEDERLSFLLGISTNARLKKCAEKLVDKAHRKFLRIGEKVRLFTSIRYRARRKWPRTYRVVIKAEWSALGSNVRFVVTNLKGRAQALYERYGQRGESSENSIKDLKNALLADRLSCHRFWSNQFRLLLHASAYVLLHSLRRAAKGTELEVAQMDTLRLRLLKIGVLVQSTARRVWFHLSSGYPWQALWLLLAQRLAVAAPFG